MNLKLTAFLPWMVLAGVAHGQVRSANVVYTYRDSHSLQAYRLGDECFVPVNALNSWGWRVAKQGDSVNLSLEGHTVRLETRFVSGQPAIPLRKAVAEVGGSSSWTPGTDTLNVYSVLSEISVQNLRVHAEGALPFKSTPYYISPGKTIIELDGVRLGQDTHEEFPDTVKAVQYRPNEVRLTISTPFIPKLAEEAATESTEFDYQIVKDQDLSENQATEGNHVALSVDSGVDSKHGVSAKSANQHPITMANPGQVNLSQTDPAQSGGTQASGSQSGAPGILSVTLSEETDTSTGIGIHFGSPLAGKIQFERPDPASLEILFPVTAQLSNNGGQLGSSLIQDISARPSGTSTLVTVHLSRSMGAEMIPDPNGVTINLFKPRGGVSGLSGKVVVVDPGHGGHDNGAHEGPVNEKDLNLSIGLKLGQQLVAAGATVILTRKDDTFITLLERSAISNRNHADFFISCHINSAGGTSQSGTITFHHKGNKISKFLAECIQDQLRRVNGLPNRGTQSDGVLYNGGLSVLRNTTSPAVLIEMGFINNPHDRSRMLTQDFQNSVSSAIVKGLRVYLGDSKPNE